MNELVSYIFCEIHINNLMRKYQFILTLFFINIYESLMEVIVSLCNNILLSFSKDEKFNVINEVLYVDYKRHCAILLFFIFDILDTQIKSFPRKKSVATMFVSFHHSSWNLTVRFRLTESAICRSPPDRLKKMSNGNGVNSAITAHNGF